MTACSKEHRAELLERTAGAVPGQGYRVDFGKKALHPEDAGGTEQAPQEFDHSTSLREFKDHLDNTLRHKGGDC